jgi:hypothetical protein
MRMSYLLKQTQARSARGTAGQLVTGTAGALRISSRLLSRRDADDRAAGRLQKNLYGFEKMNYES